MKYFDWIFNCLLYLFLCLELNECFHLSEINNEDIMFFYWVFCNFMIIKPFELRCTTNHRCESYFYNVRYQFYIHYVSTALGMSGETHAWSQAWYAKACIIWYLWSNEMMASSILHFFFFLYWKDYLKIFWRAKSLRFLCSWLQINHFPLYSYFGFLAKRMFPVLASQHDVQYAYLITSCSLYDNWIFWCLSKTKSLMSIEDSVLIGTENLMSTYPSSLQPIPCQKYCDD